MPDQLISTTGLLKAMPREMRRRILSGMRSTLWLSCLGMPMGFATTLLLARTGPEVIGTYGLLTVYLGITTTFFYVGGDTVVIRFMPLLPSERRLSFLVSYLSVIVLVLTSWIMIAAIWPNKLHYIFGDLSYNRFYLLILSASLVYICFSMIVATLKGTLEISFAQVLLRLVTIGSFIVYATLFAFGRGLLSTYYVPLIWTVYLGLAAIGTALGAQHLFHLDGWGSLGSHITFFLPKGFWRYMLVTQLVSLVSFVSTKTDYILILNLGGLETLGKYVAVSSFSSIVLLATNLVLETLLPSLTNLVAAGNLLGASEVFGIHMRILFVVATAVTCGLMLCAGFLLMLLGPTYQALKLPVILLVLLVGLAAPGSVGGTLLSGVGKQQYAAWIGLMQAVVFVAILFGLWAEFHLLGAILAYGVAMLVSNVLLLWVAKYRVQIEFTTGRDYVVFALVAFLCFGIANWERLGVVTGILGWAAMVGLFLLLSRYTVQECVALSNCFVPNRLARGLE